VFIFFGNALMVIGISSSGWCIASEGSRVGNISWPPHSRIQHDYKQIHKLIYGGTLTNNGEKILMNKLWEELIDMLAATLAPKTECV
jgi:hypothetical protein